MPQLEQLALRFTDRTEEWVDRVIARLRVRVANQGVVSADDVQDICSVVGHPEHQNHHGILWNKLRRMGLEKTGEMVTSRTRTNNSRRVPTWRAGAGWPGGVA